MNSLKKITLIILTFLLFLPISANALEKEINIHLFYGETCPHCAKEKEFLDKYLKDKDNINLYKYEVWNNDENKDKFNQAQKILNVTAKGVPYLVIGNKVIQGYNETNTSKDIEETINYYLENNYRDILGEEFNIVEKNESIEMESQENNSFNIPLLGEINAKTTSLPLIAIIIGSVDGFNPCAMWILILLITLLIGMNDRKKMWILGLTFILTSAIVYLLFMVSWLNLATFMNSISIIRLIIGLIAIIFGTTNIIKFFKTKDTGCEVVNTTKRKKIITSIKKITTEKKFIIALFGTIILAASVNIIELLCSLGLPVMFTQILSMNNLSKVEYSIYIFIYMLFFMLDDIIIFIIAMKTLKIKAVSNKYTKYSHIIGGIIMLIIGLLMIFKPEWLMFNF